MSCDLIDNRQLARIFGHILECTCDLSLGIISITDTTKDYLKTLDQDVNIYVLAAEKNADSTLSETLQRYEDLSGHVKVSYVNPSTNPTFFQKYTTDAPASNSLIVASDARSRVIDYNDIYEYSYDYSSYSRSLDGYDAEGQITSALQYGAKIYFPLTEEV